MDNEEPKTYDPYGIGKALEHGMRMFMHGKRGTGRTDYMLDTVQEGDVIVTCLYTEAQRLEYEVRKRGFKDVRVMLVIRPTLAEAYERICGIGPRRVVFDHLFLESYYSQSIDSAIYYLSKMKEDLDKRYESHQKRVAAPIHWDGHDAILAMGGDPDQNGGPND